MAPRTFKVRSRDELMNAPDPQFLIDSIIPERSLTFLIGPPGIGKTFFALGLCFSVCVDMAWLGHETTSGSVIYITPEGLSGFKLRLQALETYHGAKAENFAYITEAPQFLNTSEIRTLIESINSSPIIKPKLIVIDTLARHVVGGDENSAQSMGELIANADMLRNAFDCTVLFVHHTGKAKNNSSERGSSALRGAADTMILMNGKIDQVSISCEKQKDSEPFKDIPVRLHNVRLTHETNSCVLVRRESGFSSSDKLDKEKERILLALLNADIHGLRTKELIEITQIPESSYHRHREHLVNNNFIQSGPGQRYSLTQKGREYTLTLKPLPEGSHESVTSTPITPTPL